MSLEKKVAIILAAGQGKRMNSKVQKQYMQLCGKPVLFYSLSAFQESTIDEIILVVGKGEIAYCQSEIVEKYSFNKVVKIVEGGTERYHSVYHGIKAIQNADYVYIHDGARPFISNEILDRVTVGVREYNACVVGMPVKDTIKIVDENGFVIETPSRDLVWQVQTPQVFAFALIKEAYEKLMEESIQGITDDAMVVEAILSYPIKLIEGDYTNFKITTPEDIYMAEQYLKEL
ncbi:2-C-methyl-D-erythritol 4-phosphate cytidylyltransferase [Anaerosacchariphilus polymeriproducens]|uniref:2-C-methyl-D-erythritol 4-phosphate cytidylyltransferase n=1 Tax=Anaerosacchariphilus polymeriproducens TaxID=1812858 RepID=A0A371AVM2_9FIRM|nr:2-C-methyl-D-erythritol 4-phosphate cytidylyltransferase [Anaerosacchariphilus polymeriproducens]RDU23589.1 2-C-methyl-D-erythritol 4-phosphate cytidylyltransferase [Anaerosacchariphilus polymeriproducens]